jgi:hypothetical protein
MNKSTTYKNSLIIFYLELTYLEFDVRRIYVEKIDF